METSKYFQKAMAADNFRIGHNYNLFASYVFRSVLLPFICGLVLAYLLYPLISWLERKLPGQGRWLSARRASLIALIFIVILVVVGILAFYIVTGVVSSFSILLKNAPSIFLKVCGPYRVGFKVFNNGFLLKHSSR